MTIREAMVGNEGNSRLEILGTRGKVSMRENVTVETASLPLDLTVINLLNGVFLY